METVFLICGLGGGAILLVQVLMIGLGLGGDHDIVDGHALDTHQDASVFFGLLSFKAMVAAITFFGLGGMAMQSAGLGGPVAILAGIFMGFVAMVVVAWLLRVLMRLQSEGNVHIENAIGQTAIVYLSVPGDKKGTGKITVTLQDRTMEYAAITTETAALPTGSTVRIVGMAGPDTLVVAPALDRDLAML